MRISSLLLLVSLGSCQAFHNIAQTTPLSLKTQRVPALNIIPLELGSADVIIAITSAAAGAASQIPKINELEESRKALERDLEVVQGALSSSKQELASKISKMEDAIFEMDTEFEGQTTRMKKNYDNTLRVELETLTIDLKAKFQAQTETLMEKIDAETELKLSVQEGQLKQEFLKEKMQFLKDNGEKKRTDLAILMKSQAKISAANRELDEALIASKKEIEKLADSKKKGWWPF